MKKFLLRILATVLSGIVGFVPTFVMAVTLKGSWDSITVTKILIACFSGSCVLSFFVAFRERAVNRWDMKKTICFFALFHLCLLVILYFIIALITCILKGENLSVYFPNPWI